MSRALYIGIFFSTFTLTNIIYFFKKPIPMLSRIVIIIAFLPLFLKAQISQECGYKMTAAQLLQHYARVQAVPALLPHDTCLHRELSLVFHIVLDSTGFWIVQASPE
jgi:hypothetical protein